MAIPTHFNKYGVLEPGTYAATLSEIRGSLLVKGDGSSATWDVGRRLYLLNQLSVLVGQLLKVGISDICIDGSYVEDKDSPNDIDGYFDSGLSMDNIADMTKFQKQISELNTIDPHKVWNWDPRSRRPFPGFAKAQLPMWHFYRVELFPHLRQPAGITDQYGNELQFPSAFRQSRRNFIPKGIIKIIS